MSRTTRVYGRDDRRPVHMPFGWSWGSQGTVARRHNIFDVVYFRKLADEAFDLLNKDDFDMI